ncbi:DNA-binding transcriptional regulator, MarR family [Rubrimonas cliftonensis]|uniref:DNA-binding transcriptional regulator, MarR family n=2 Tax=Rubrimonas cliftonensis TaxID=89524 RepID=A0A1H4D475_9RHOB|nr:DNA-binding transcriptional regulator, MarR family [Rubrimonas cliftonensis]
MEGALETRALVKALRRIARAVELQSRRIGRETGLTLPQLAVLACARDLGESATTRAIAAEADVSGATVVAILDKLEAKRLIVRNRSTVDRRVVHTRLTETGLCALAAAPPVLGDRFAARFAALPAEQRRAMAESFATVADMAAPQGEQATADDAPPELGGPFDPL